MPSKQEKELKDRYDSYISQTTRGVVEGDRARDTSHMESSVEIVDTHDCFQRIYEQAIVSCRPEDFSRVVEALSIIEREMQDLLNQNEESLDADSFRAHIGKSLADLRKLTPDLVVSLSGCMKDRAQTRGDKYREVVEKALTS